MSLAALAVCVSFAVVGCGGGGDPEPLEITEEDVKLQEESSSGMEEAMREMGKKKKK